MGIKRVNMDIQSSIQLFIKEFLSTSELNEEMQHATLNLLHLDGKIFNKHTYFTWGEFSYHVFSLLVEEKQIDKIEHAAAIELLILSTDIIDDIIDDDISAETLNTLSKPHALMLSNALLIKSVYLLVKNSISNPIESFIKINKNLLNANNGQWRDHSFTIDTTTATEENYFGLIKKKSCSLIQLIFELYDLKEDTVLKEISTYIGYSGQIKNDVRDIFSIFKSDIAHKKATLPIIKALEYSREKDGGILAKMFKQIEENYPSSEIINEIKIYIEKSGAIDYCLILEKMYINKTKILLNQHFSNRKIQVANLIELLD